jgi:hypothetical protein
VERSETFLQFAQDIFVHGITSSKIGWIFQGSIRLSPTLQSITFSWRNTLCKGRIAPGKRAWKKIKEQTPQCYAGMCRRSPESGEENEN